MRWIVLQTQYSGDAEPDILEITFSFVSWFLWVHPVREARGRWRGRKKNLFPVSIQTKFLVPPLSSWYTDISQMYYLDSSRET